MDAFVLHPKGLGVPATKNSADLFGILNTQRGLPRRSQKSCLRRGAGGERLGAGGDGQGAKRRLASWMRRAGRALLLGSGRLPRNRPGCIYECPCGLNREYFSRQLLHRAPAGLRPSGNRQCIGNLDACGCCGLWHGRARVERQRRFFRSTSATSSVLHTSATCCFCSGFIPAMAQISSLAATLVTFLGVWLGAAQAHDLKGWRSLLLPVVAVVVTAIGLFHPICPRQRTWVDGKHIYAEFRRYKSDVNKCRPGSAMAGCHCRPVYRSTSGKY